MSDIRRICFIRFVAVVLGCLFLIAFPCRAMNPPQKLVTDEGPDAEYLLLDGAGFPVPGEEYGWLWSDHSQKQVKVFWDDSEAVLDHGAGTCMRGVLPGSPGPVILAGHVLSYFSFLQFLQKGDLLHLDTWYGQYDYEITDIEVYDQFDLQRLIDQKVGRQIVWMNMEDALQAGSAQKTDQDREEELILYTCYPFYPMTEEKTERYTLIARKVAGPSVIWVEEGPQVIYSEASN